MESLQGHLLIASPRLMDPNFARSVVLIVQHNESGAMGLILNRPLDVNVQTVWEQVSELLQQASHLLHASARPPRTPGTIRVSATTAAFRLKEGR